LFSLLSTSHINLPAGIAKAECLHRYDNGAVQVKGSPVRIDTYRLPDYNLISSITVSLSIGDGHPAVGIL